VLLGAAIIGIYVGVQWFKRIECPNCRNRLLVRQEGRELVKDQAGQKLKTFTGPSLGTAGPFHFSERKLPVNVNRREYVYSYRCDHCAYSWRVRKNSEDEDV
jgi:DNA-directed RNA polymerase subunit RPC12/RpoP